VSLSRRAAFTILGLLALAGAAALVLVFRREEVDWLEAVPRWGWLGIAACVAAYLPLAFLGLPASWLTALAGFWFGPWAALAIATVGANSGANAVFAVSRRWFRPRVAAWLAPRPRLGALVRAVGEDGFRITLLVRLSPLSPFGVTTYALSLAPLRQLPFALGTLLGKTPGNLFYAMLGAGARSAWDAARGEGSLGSLEVWSLALGIAATGLLAWVLQRHARRALAKSGLTRP
jgi:uncharacterized membrane protein YdjX (TVP38/TMEM64 family)